MTPFDLSQKFRQYWFWVFILSGSLLLSAWIILEIVGLLDIARFRYPLAVQDWADIIGAGGSLLLTGTLAYLYDKMYSTQQKQVAGLEEQMRWMAAQYKPYLNIADFEFPIEDVGGVEKMDIKVSNVGNGLARDLKIRCDLRISLEQHSFVPIGNLVFKYNNDKYTLHPKSSRLVPRGELTHMYRGQWVSGGIISTNETEWFEGRLPVVLSEGKTGSGGEHIGLADAVSLMAESKVTNYDGEIMSVCVQVSVIYRDMGSKIGYEKAFSSRLHPIPYTSLSEIENEKGAGGCNISFSNILSEVEKEDPFPPDFHVPQIDGKNLN